MPAPPLTPLAAAALHVGEPERVLVVDCGEGEGALFLAREFPRAAVRGIDPSEEAVRRAAARIGLDPEGRVAFKPGRGASIPFPDDHFDLLALLDSRPRLGEAARVLRPGGRLALASSRRPEVGAGRLFGWSAYRHGFDAVYADRAGDGAFVVYRLTS
jgi:SAM-dependent methyltransferase